MANNKTGFDYYNVDTDRYQDIRIKRLKKDNGPAGIAVYDYILCEIYRVRGCFLEWDKNTAFDVAEYFGLEEKRVNEIVNYCAAVGLFDKELLRCERVLTSRSIQQRYTEMSIRAKRKDFKIPERIIKIPEESPKIPEESPKIPEESPKIPEVCRKVKESKVKDNKLSSPLPPKGEGGGDFLSSNMSRRDGIQRNLEGLCMEMNRLGISQGEQDQIMMLSNYGQIGHPVWRLLRQCIDSIGKSTFDRSRIKMPGRYIIAKLKEGRGDGG